MPKVFIDLQPPIIKYWATGQLKDGVKVNIVPKKNQAK